jgi:hypothetical protein
MNEQQFLKVNEIEKLLDITTVSAQDWVNESSRLYLVIKMLFDKEFLAT